MRLSVTRRGEPRAIGNQPTTGQLRQSDDVDLHQHVLGQAGDLDGRTRGRIGGEVAAVNFVHGGEVVHALQKDGGLDHLRQRAAGGGQNACDVLQDALGLRGDVSGDELLRVGIERDLSGEKDKSVGLDGLGVGSYGLGPGSWWR